jgi:hypothetical protein
MSAGRFRRRWCRGCGSRRQIHGLDLIDICPRLGAGELSTRGHPIGNERPAQRPCSRYLRWSAPCAKTRSIPVTPTMTTAGQSGGRRALAHGAPSAEIASRRSSSPDARTGYRPRGVVRESAGPCRPHHVRDGSGVRCAPNPSLATSRPLTISMRCGRPGRPCW